jgi:hypothetical protein
MYSSAARAGTRSTASSQLQHAAVGQPAQCDVRQPPRRGFFGREVGWMLAFAQPHPHNALAAWLLESVEQRVQQRARDVRQRAIGVAHETSA